MESRPYKRGPVQGFIHQPDGPVTAGLVITHGAGSSCEAPLLVAFAKAFCRAGVLVLRCDLPFRQKRRYGPPIPAKADEDRAGLMEAIVSIREMSTGPLFLGGHSYGGPPSYHPRGR